MDNVKFIDSDGKEVECKVLSIYKSEKTKTNYVIYTDKTFDENNKQNVYANEFVEEENSVVLKDISDNDDIEAIRKIVENF